MLRRYIVLVLLIAVFASGCMSTGRRPTVETQLGLVSVGDTEEISPYGIPVVPAVVRPAPLLGADYEECEGSLAQPFVRMCIVDWKRTVIAPEAKDKISLVLMNGDRATRFRVVFVGHRLGGLPEEIALSREYVAPRHWSGELEFAIDIKPPFTRVFFLQVQWHTEQGWSGSTNNAVFAPCPPELPWPEGEKELCDSVAR